MENQEIRQNVRSWLTDPNLSEEDIKSQVHDLFESLKDDEGRLWITVPPPTEYRISRVRTETGTINAGVIRADKIWVDQSKGE